MLKDTQAASGRSPKTTVKKKDKDKVVEEENYEKTRVVYSEVEKNIVGEFERSIIGETLFPMDIVLIEAKLRGTFLPFESIRTMGAYKALINFASKEDMYETMKEGVSVLREYFDELRIWANEEVCQTRRVWLEYFGMPLHAWSIENLRKIAELWGTVIYFDEQTLKQPSFNSAKILMDTCCFSFI